MERPIKSKRNLTFNIINLAIQLTVVCLFIYNIYLQQMQLEMLKARGVIQAINFRALKRANLLLPEEEKKIEDSWKDADYKSEFIDKEEEEK